MKGTREQDAAHQEKRSREAPGVRAQEGVLRRPSAPLLSLETPSRRQVGDSGDSGDRRVRALRQHPWQPIPTALVGTSAGSMGLEPCLAAGQAPPQGARDHPVQPSLPTQTN
ncbi:hypothetical protein H8959_005035 [Pygathrix nigripes]